MFYIDATLFCSYITGESTSTWQPTNYWPEFVYSTLAHEFQHMIQFYQKQILQNVGGTDTWINEMCSMIMEDLVADKLQVNGPRGVSDVAYADGSPGPSGNTDGRIPSFNQYSYYPLAQPGAFDLADYSTSYAFGAWLARNYGGADLLKRIVQCPETDDTAVINAVAAASGRKDETMQRLLEKWASAVLLSDTTAGVPAGYVYNTGGWMTSTSGGITYNLGSIDIFNYSPTLKVFTNTGSLAPGVTFTHSSNVYYEAAQALKAPQTWSLTVPPGIVMSVVLK
jgi:hypothetical protein